jgi:hypothetical protein
MWSLALTSQRERSNRSGRGTSCGSALQLREEAPMLGTRAKQPQNARNEHAHPSRFPNQVVEPSINSHSAIRSAYRRHERDEDAPAEAGLRPHARSQHANRVHIPQHDDYHLCVEDLVVGRPFLQFGDAESAMLQGLPRRAFAPGAVNDQE